MAGIINWVHHMISGDNIGLLAFILLLTTIPVSGIIFHVYFALKRRHLKKMTRGEF